MKLTDSDLELLRALVPEQAQLGGAQAPMRTLHEIAVAVDVSWREVRRWLVDLEERGAVKLARRIGGAEFWRATQRGEEALEIAHLEKSDRSQQSGVLPAAAAGVSSG